MPKTTSEFAPTLANKVEEMTQHQAAVGKKLICCPPDDKLSALMSKILPLYRKAHKICAKALG